LQAGHGSAAAELAAAALQQQPDNLQAMAIAGAALGQCGEYLQSRYWLQRLLQHQPGNTHALINLAQVHRHLDDPYAAIDCLQLALKLKPGDDRARFQLANAYQQCGQLTQADAQLRALLQNRPDHVDALAMLADLEQARGDSERARQGYQRALRLQADHVVASIGLAAEEIHGGDPVAAQHRLNKLIQGSKLSQRNQAIATQRMGMAHQALGNHAQAFAAFQQANSLLQDLHDQQTAASDTAASDTAASDTADSDTAGSVYAPAFLRRLLADVQSLAEHRTGSAQRILAEEASVADDDKHRQPVFLLGFPRSGTTLLEQMLIAHPQVDSIEENDNLVDLHGLLLQARQPLQRLMQLPPQQRAEFRRAYWQRLDAMHARNPSGSASGTTVVIDKLPLNSVLLPVISNLFPQAKILFALRDPRAVVFSCWQQLFALNDAMVQFLNLNSSINYYDLIMQLVSTSLSHLPVDQLQVRHETLLQEPEKTLRHVLAFMELPWHDAVLDTKRRGHSRYIDTPSAQQIRQPLNSSGTQRWRHYAAMLPAEFSRLDEWARHWGYPEQVSTDGRNVGVSPEQSRPIDSPPPQ